MDTLHSNEYRAIVQRLILARQKMGFTQVEVAKKLKKGQSYISKIENCQQRIDALELKELAALYKTDISKLL
jgi:transcriptional regulator with XRE-family HTH domain